jgi:hypothetical protein
VGAHVTLFHALPAALRAEVEGALGEVHGELDVEVTGVRSLGRGVAYALSCPALEQRHRAWQRRWRDHLTRQDAQGLRLHATVQNKVTPDEARVTYADLDARFEPWTARGVSLELWEYLDGPWRALRSFPLRP